MHESFEGMSSVQLSGFISILEREYSVDLSELRESAKRYFEKNAPAIKKAKIDKVFLAHNRRRDFTAAYMILGAAIFIFFAYYTIQPSQNEVLRVDNTTINSAQNNISVAENNISTIDSNISIGENNISTIENNVSIGKSTTVADENNISTEENEKKSSINTQEESEPPIETKSKEITMDNTSFKIKSKNNLWIGYIDLKTYEKHNKTFSGEFILDAQKDWLLSFGHGYITIEINNEIKKFNNATNMRFSYINSELKEIDFEEFKSLNRGNKW
ncbi:MAG: hypothetical protein A3G74_04315 [Sulfurimonas sp. RIFCSPLOWO2_12_FULL_34_6]|nr:MAG: hypothetical protein A3G74_04315 [Sulfurimonas sp. RIFCSPLOWO2_12_FULL_34_6]